MDTSNHSMANLFMQLGLDNNPGDITRFISNHKLPEHVPLVDAPYWSEAQASFLRESFKEDADWVMTIDELNAQLHN